MRENRIPRLVLRIIYCFFFKSLRMKEYTMDTIATDSLMTPIHEPTKMS